MSSLAEEIVDAINDISGVHPGHRSAHAKGTLLTGTFTPSGNASGLTTAPHLQDEPVRVTARFSNGGGDPGIPDYAREGRGMAVKFYLTDGGTTDIVGLTLPCFFVRTPEDFLSFTQARKDPERLMPDWLGAHPEALTAIQAALGADPPASYATCVYNSIHSYRWLDGDGGSRFVRYQFEPEAGEQTLSGDDAKARGRDYLQEDILARGETAFRLQVIVAAERDSHPDPVVRRKMLVLWSTHCGVSREQTAAVAGRGRDRRGRPGAPSPALPTASRRGRCLPPWCDLRPRSGWRTPRRRRSLRNGAKP